MTFQHRAGVTPYTSSCDLAESYVLVKQLLGPIYCDSFEHPLLRTYGVILPSSLATVLSLSLGYSPRPPVSVLVRAAYGLTLEAFLESWYHTLHYLVARSLVTWFGFRTRICLCASYVHAMPNPLRTSANLLCHSIIPYAGAGISTCWSSTTPVGLALVPD